VAVFAGTGTLGADPDLVIGNPPAVAVGDVRYKAWEGTAKPRDLYQLRVHAATFGTDEAFLVYPSDGFQEVDLARSSTGCRTRIFAIDVRDVQSHLRRVFESVSGERSGRSAGASDAILRGAGRG
jgi:hypothetical protein